MVAVDGNPAGLTFLVIQALFTALALLAIGLRVRARRYTRASLEFSDYAIFVAILLVLGQAGAGIVGVVVGGTGVHAAGLSSAQLDVFYKSLFAEDLCWMVANCFVKLSILDFLNSIFHRKPWFPRYTYPLMGLVGLACAGCCIAQFVVCRPLLSTWNYAPADSTCLSGSPMSLTSAGISLGFDLAIFILPIPVILGLQMRMARKVALFGVFGLGAVICVLAGLRLASLMTAEPSDLPFSTIGTSIWSILDNTLGVISACLPLLPPLFNQNFTRNLGTRRFSDETMNHSPSSSMGDGRNVIGSAHNGDMSSLAWGGTNRSSGRPDGVWGPDPQHLLHPYDRPRAYRGLGGRQERALGPPLAFNPRLFYPPPLREALSTHGSISSMHTSSFFSSSAIPSRNASQQQGRESCGASRAGSRLGSRVASRLGSRHGSRHGSRSGSRLGRHSDEEEGLDLTCYPTEEYIDDSKARVTIVAEGRREGDDEEIESGLDSKGITITTTWDIDVESLKSTPNEGSRDSEVLEDHELHETHGRPMEVQVASESTQGRPPSDASQV